MSYVIKCDFCDETIVEIQNINTFRIDDRGNIISIGKDMCGKCYDELSKDNANKKITNYEKIRNMNKEDMIKFLAYNGSCQWCIYEVETCVLNCNEGHKNWLEDK
ncbi:hypothetical protein [Clostridioides sp. ES-S-0048-02]|uniref:hypothetical protein n=1 Tax=Clostridioides sp. ES-S-0048-02 TaxID=2770777 RepID=UPI001D12D382|nr:hypothetical protein [Clostridioides sp. ES-S-0048-02]